MAGSTPAARIESVVLPIRNLSMRILEMCMGWQQEVRDLVEGGHASSFNEGKKLRETITKKGETVSQFLTARPAASPYGDMVPSGAEESSDLTALMRSEGISRAHATLLRGQIIDSGRSVKEFLLASARDSPYGAPSTTEMFRRAGELIEMAGSVDRAIQALKAFNELNATPE